MKDILGRTLKVGDTVLVTGYGSTAMDTVTNVERIKPNYIIVTIPFNYFDYNIGLTKNVLIKANRKMTRKHYQVLVINDQLKENERIGEPYVSPNDVP
jgi:hypothetical protein